MAWVDGDGVRLWAERRGEGPPLLFISGTGGDLRVPPTGFDSPLASSFDLVCYDQRGLGQSTRPPTPWSMADYADDAAAVLDWAGWEQAAVLGVSFGGMVAQELLLRHPTRVGRAVLACTSSGGAGGSSYPLHLLADRPPGEDQIAEHLALIDTRWADPASADPMRSQVAEGLSRRGAADAGGRAQLAARRDHDTWDRLPAIEAPVLVCSGRWDGIAPLANAEALARHIPGARLSVFDGGHLFFVQVPSAMVVTADFLLGTDDG